MKKFKNLKIMASIQALLLSGATLSALVSCGDDVNEVAENVTLDVDPVAVVYTDDNSYEIASEVITTYTTVKAEDSSKESIITENEDKVTEKIEDNINESINDISGNKSSDDEKIINSDVKAEVTNKINDYKQVLTSKTTIKATTPVTSKTTVKATSPVTKKTTAKVTTVTKKTTAKVTTVTKPVTTKTVTTTVAVTEPPIVTEAPRLEYNINEICYDVNAFNYYVDKLSDEMRTSGDGTYNSLVKIGDNYTNFCPEAGYLLVLLNYGTIDDNVIARAFSEYPSENVHACYNITYSIGQLQKNFNNNIDFEKYCCDQCKYVGQYVNVLNDNYQRGNINSFIDDQVINGNIDSLYLNNLAVRCFIDGYSSGSLFLDEFLYACNDFNDYFFSKALGNSLVY